MTVTTDPALERIRDVARRRIDETHVAGRDTRHNRAANLQAVQSVVDGDSHYTWDITGVDRFSFNEILGAISSITACSSDPNVTTGGGYISPELTLNALESASRQIAAVARRGGRFLLGTGHPGSLIVFYIELARLIRSWGGDILEPAKGEKVPPNLELDYVDGVAVTSDRASLMHSHAHAAMDLMLERAGKVDLVVADHGYASGAINAKIPVIAVMDTNDPALALAQELGADLTIIPMDDNRPLSAYLPIVETIQEFGEYFEPSLSDSGVTEPAARAEADRRLREADRYIDECLPQRDGLNDIVRSLIESQKDQLFQTAMEPDEHDQRAADPYLELALYRRLHEAFHNAVARRLESADSGLSRAQIASYLNGVHDAPKSSEKQ